MLHLSITSPFSRGRPYVNMHALHTSPAQLLFPKYSWRDRASNPALFYFTSHHEANDHLARLSPGPLGFDMEWRPNVRKGQPENPVALIQLSTANTVILLHIHLMTEFPNKLTDLLASQAWIKAGVNIRNDCAKLYNDYGVSVYNCVELSLLARSVDNDRWKGRYTDLLGLARLVETYEQARLLKGRIQRSNWEQYLDGSQQEYAANDAHAGYVIYTHLANKAQAIPLRNYYSFSLVDGLLCDRLGISPWQAHNPYYDPGPPPPPKPKCSGKDNQDSTPAIASEVKQDT